MRNVDLPIFCKIDERGHEECIGLLHKCARGFVGNGTFPGRSRGNGVRIAEEVNLALLDIFWTIAIAVAD